MGVRTLISLILLLSTFIHALYKFLSTFFFFRMFSFVTLQEFIDLGKNFFYLGTRFTLPHYLVLFSKSVTFMVKSSRSKKGLQTLPYHSFQTSNTGADLGGGGGQQGGIGPSLKFSGRGRHPLVFFQGGADFICPPLNIDIGSRLAIIQP